MLSVFEKPTCIVNSGHHDVLIQGMTEETYVANVKWYLHLLAGQCERLLWLATTSPETNNFPQKINTTRVWGLAVKDMLEQDAVLGMKSVYIDVFEASRDFPHKDNSTWRKRRMARRVLHLTPHSPCLFSVVHMTPEWYEHLSEIFAAETMYHCDKRW
jgi:hypothetical protein